MMGRLLEVSSLTKEECDRILQVIQKDFELREQEKKRLSLIKEEISEESTKTTILAKQKNFNDNCCMRCFRTFVFLFRSRVHCDVCKFNVCKDCCSWNKEVEVYVCHVCQRQINLKLQSCDWFYENVRKRFKRFGSAKVLRSLYKKNIESESENDSGYDHSIKSTQQGFGKTRPTFQNLFLEESLNGSDGLMPLDEVEAARQSFDTIKAEEFVKFREDLSNILKEMEVALDSHSQGALSEEDQGTYDEAMSAYQTHIRNTLANLVGTMHSAELMTAGGDMMAAPTHENIKELVTKQAEQVLGRPLELPIVDPSLPNTSVDSGQPFEDLLSRALVHNVLEKYRHQARTKQEQLDLRQTAPLSNEDLSTISGVDEVNLDDSTLQEHQVPLPSFKEDDSMREVDPDMLSVAGTDYSSVLPETDVESHLTWDTESAVSNRSWTGNWFFREKHQISPYDNFGNKILGNTEREDSLMMYVPKANQPLAATVGEKNVDDLSELSDDTLTDDEEDTVDMECSPDVLTKYQHFLEGEEEDEDEDELESLASFNAAILDDSEGSFSPRTSSFKKEKRSENLKSKKKHARKTGDKFPAETSPNSSDRLELSSLQRTAASNQLPVQEVQDSTKEIKSPKEASPGHLTGTVSETISDDEPVESGMEVDDPKFVIKPISVKVLEGETAQIKCEVKGTQPIDVFWYRDNKTVVQLEDEDKYECSTEADVHTLEVFDTTKADQGQYMCIVINEKGQSYWTFGLKVEDNPMDKSKPEFLKQPASVEVIEGQSAKLRCKVKGYPPPRVLWFKDGKKIYSSEECTIMKTGNRDYMLYIDAASLDDDAEYTVSARNICGEVKCSVELLVEPAPEALPNVESKSIPQSEVKSKSILQFVQTSKNPPAGKDGSKDTRKQSVDDNVSAKSDYNSNTQHAKSTLPQFSEDGKSKSLQMTHSQNNNPEQGVEHHFPSGERQYHIVDEEALLTEHENMTSTAKTVRKLTSTALQVLNSAEDIVKASSDQVAQEPKVQKKKVLSGEKRKSTAISPVKEGVSERHEEKYTKGSKSKIPQGGLKAVSHLEVDPQPSNPDDVLKIQCGLHRIDSKRYKRDFIVNRKTDSVKLAESGPSAKLESIPQGQSVDEEVAEQEEKIYMTAGKVFSLEDRIQRLQHQVEETTEDTSNEDMSYLEDQVARAAAQVTQRQREVTSIETKVGRLHERSYERKNSEEAHEAQLSSEEEPDSREEVEELRLPSVKSLREKFKQGL
ncbi:titin [Lingula anatina]|uniref:Titin n=1 Tax=Lingula anatina TaxID=7574 RepID=A0A1S3JQ75_LINAN|nr:titin [Lingula anatina]|eukprot:XP_013412510.1 titin [Lingula anatina]